jgi:Ser/Thr protein kinase RdoA (MazF antagonist)
MHAPLPDAARAALLFALPQQPASVTPYGNGHINDTFLVVCEGDAGPPQRFILQRINTHVFKDPLAVMSNIAAVTRHLRERLTREADPAEGCALALVPARDGRDYAIDEEGGVWRTFDYVEGVTLDASTGPAAAREAARAFGRFQRHLCDYAGPRLAYTIPRFHDTPDRLARFEAAVREDRFGRARGARAEIEALLSRAPLASGLAEHAARGVLPERVVHNDTKINNVRFSEAGGAVCVIDLDTVMPGLALHDFGDLVRSAAATAAEDERDLSLVAADPEIVAALAEGYLSEAAAFLTPEEKGALLLSGHVMTYQQGLRFLTDHLQGDRYFRVHREGHNLDRARTHVRLLESLEAQHDELEARVATAVDGAGAPGA